MFRRKPVALKKISTNMTASVERSFSEAETAERSFERCITPKFLKNKIALPSASSLQISSGAKDRKLGFTENQPSEANRVPDFASQMRGLKLFKRLKKEGNESAEAVNPKSSLNQQLFPGNSQYTIKTSTDQEPQCPNSRKLIFSSPIIERKQRKPTLINSLQIGILEKSHEKLPKTLGKVKQVMNFEDFKKMQSMQNREISSPISILKHAELRSPQLRMKPNLLRSGDQSCDVKDKNVKFSRQIVYYYFNGD